MTRRGLSEDELGSLIMGCLSLESEARALSEDVIRQLPSRNKRHTLAILGEVRRAVAKASKLLEELEVDND